jgi:hypothetical protein
VCRGGGLVVFVLAPGQRFEKGRETGADSGRAAKSDASHDAARRLKGGAMDTVAQARSAIRNACEGEGWIGPGACFDIRCPSASGSLQLGHREIARRVAAVSIGREADDGQESGSG